MRNADRGLDDAPGGRPGPLHCLSGVSEGFHRLCARREAEDAALDELHRRLLEKVNAGDIGGAEDLLFAESDPGDRRYLELAVDFYARLNDLTDAQLEAAGFGRDELEEGLRDMAGRFGVSLL